MGLVIILQSVVIVILLIQRNTETRLRRRFVQRVNLKHMYTNRVYSTVLLTMSMALYPLSITMVK